MAMCFICGETTHPEKYGINYGCEYGIVRLDGRGDLVYEFDVCEKCMPKVITAVESLKK